MSNPLDTDAGSEMFASYENELKLVQADLNQKLDQIAEASGEQRKSAIGIATQVLEEATELVSPPNPSARFHAPHYENNQQPQEQETLTQSIPI